MAASHDRPAPLRNTRATSSPRSGEIGVLPVDELPQGQNEPLDMRIVVHCPQCDSYAVISGVGTIYNHITKLVDPVFACSGCLWRPQDEHDTPLRWRVFYAGRHGGTLLWAVNEEHLQTLLAYFETAPLRRGEIEFDWEYGRLMQRLPQELTSGRVRHDVVSLAKRLAKTRPRHVAI